MPHTINQYFTFQPIKPLNFNIQIDFYSHLHNQLNIMVELWKFQLKVSQRGSVKYRLDWIRIFPIVFLSAASLSCETFADSMPKRKLKKQSNFLFFLSEIFCFYLYTVASFSFHNVLTSSAYSQWAKAQ